MLKIRSLLVMSLAVGAFAGTAAAHDKSPNEARFIHRALAFASQSLDRSWGKYYYKPHHDPNAPLKHAGPWVEASTAIVQPLVSTDDVAIVSWSGKTSDGIEYYLAMRITISGPPPKDGAEDLAGGMDTISADTWWASDPRPDNETNPDDARFVTRAVKAAEHDLDNSYEYTTTHDNKSAPKHTGGWLDPSKAIIRRYSANKAKADVAWEGTTKEGIRYSVFVKCDLERLPPPPTDGKPDDAGGNCVRQVADAQWGPIKKR